MTNKVRHNNSTGFLKDRLFLLPLLLCFILLKLPHLQFPFYWDECWPYATAIRRLYDAGPSLWPGVIDPVYSRGHPLLFHFLAGVWMKVFGVSFTAMHSFSLTIAAIGIIIMYEAGLRFFNKNVAVLASLLLAFQVVFFVQSSFLLPEVMLAVLGFATFCCYAAKRYWLTGITLTLLLFTKESGVIVGAVIGLDALLGLRKQSLPLKERLAAVLSVALPALLFVLFFLIQYRQQGWFIFPVHEHLIEKSPAVFLEKLRNCFDILFTHDLRQYYLLLLIVLIVLLAIVQKSIKKPLSVFGKVMRKDQGAGSRLLKLFLYFIPLFFLFSAANMLIARYLIITLLPLLLILAVLTEALVTRIHRYGIFVLLVIVAVIEAGSFAKDKGINDRNLGAFDAMKVQQDVVHYLERQQAYDIPVSTNAYLERMHLTDPYTGFLSTGHTFSKVSPELNEQTVIVIFTNIEPDDTYLSFKGNPDFQLIYKTEHGEAWGEIYRKN